MIKPRIPATFRAVAFRRIFFFTAFAVFTILGSSGCTASRTPVLAFWKKRREDVPVASTKVPEKTKIQKNTMNEPAVAANVALTSNASEEANPRHSSIAIRRKKRPLIHDGANREEASHSPNEFSTKSKPIDLNAPEFSPAAEFDPMISPFEKFDNSLLDDIQSTEILPQESLTALADRLRIDTLILQANELLEEGLLDIAEQKAKLAQELSEKTQIDYALDEDRPIDLLRRIQGQLEAARIQENLNAETGKVVTPSTPAPIRNKNETAATATKPETTSTRDSSSLARIRRDWSTLFRQKKKSTHQEPAPSATDPEQTPETTWDNSLQTNQQARPNERLDGQKAIIMANRSVSLRQPEAVTTSSVSYTTENEPTVPLEKESNVLPHSLRTETRKLVASSENLASDLVDPVRPPADTDEVGESMGDFEIEDFLKHPDKPNFPQASAVEPESNESIDPSRSSDWTPLYIGFIFSGLLAFACYRQKSS